MNPRCPHIITRSPRPGPASFCVPSGVGPERRFYPATSPRLCCDYPHPLVFNFKHRTALKASAQRSVTAEKFTAQHVCVGIEYFGNGSASFSLLLSVFLLSVGVIGYRSVLSICSTCKVPWDHEWGRIWPGIFHVFAFLIDAMWSVFLFSDNVEEETQKHS